MARPASDLRDRLIESATDTFARVGVDAASLREIAQGAETSVGMISYHFESKDGLFFELVERFYAGFLGALEAIEAEHADPVERLTALLRRIAHLDDGERHVARIIMRELTVDSERVARLAPRVMQGHVRILATAVQDATAAGRVRPVGLFEIMPVLMAPFITPQLLGIHERLGLDAEASVDTAIDVVLNGLLVP